MPAVVSHAYTLVVVMVGWVFFRADDFAQAAVIIKAMFGFALGEPVMPLVTVLTPEVLAALAIGCLFSFPLLAKLLDLAGRPRISAHESYRGPNADTLDVHVMPVPVLLIGFVFCLAILATNTLNPFLYFRF